jgi:hypothetical protein
LEQFGVPRVWVASDYFGLILETDVEHLANLGSRFMTGKLSIDDGMELVRIECEYSILAEDFVLYRLYLLPLEALTST